MNLRDIAHLRLRNQGLSEPRFEAPEDVVGWLGAVQAQEYVYAKWSLGQRAPGVTEAAVTEAIDASRIIRTHALRPTWHFLTPEDTRWVLSLTSPRVHAFMAYYNRMLELDAKTFVRSTAVIAKALAGGKRLIRKELQAALAEAGITGTGQRIGHILMYAELEGVICSGGMRGKQHAYALLEEALPAQPELTRDEALAELTRRYFRSHGPATLQDYRWWSSLTISDIRRGIAMCDGALESVEVDGTAYWYDGSLDVTPESSPAVHLLQGYDEYIVGHTGDRAYLDEASVAANVLGRATMYTHAVVIDSQVAGHWRRVATPKALTVEVQLLRPVNAAEHDALQAEVQRYGRFSGRPAVLEIVSRP